MAAELFATIYFDKDTEAVKSFDFESFNESVASNAMNIGIRYEMTEASVIPDFSDFKDLEFTTMKIEDKSGNEVPYFGTYTKIDDISVNYFSTDGVYTVSINLV